MLNNFASKGDIRRRSWGEESGISLRTVQRVESGETDPRGDTLTRLAEALEVTPDDLLEWNRREDTIYLTVLNISALSFILFPLLGVILPLVLWITKRDQIKKVDEVGKELLNFQILWTIIFFGCLIAFTIWHQYYFMTNLNSIDPSTFTNVNRPIQIIAISLYVYNVCIILLNSIQVGKRRKTWYYPRINFIR